MYVILRCLLDYPTPPDDVAIVQVLSSQSLVLNWTLPRGATVPVTMFHNTPVSGYKVQAWDNSEGVVEYVDVLTIPDATATQAIVTGLHPGTQYSLRVLALNLAGATPSLPVNITTNASGENPLTLNKVPQIGDHCFIRISGKEYHSLNRNWSMLATTNNYFISIFLPSVITSFTFSSKY